MCALAITIDLQCAEWNNVLGTLLCSLLSSSAKGSVAWLVSFFTFSTLVSVSGRSYHRHMIVAGCFKFTATPSPSTHSAHPTVQLSSSSTSSSSTTTSSCCCCSCTYDIIYLSICMTTPVGCNGMDWPGQCTIIIIIIISIRNKAPELQQQQQQKKSVE